MTRNFRQFFGFFKSSLKSLLRTPSAWAYGFAFPIIFIILFGFISSDSAPQVNIGLLKDEGTVYSAIKNTFENAKIFVPSESDNYDDLISKLKEGELDAVLSVQAGQQVLVETNANQPENVSIIKETLEKISVELTFAENKINKRAFTIREVTVNSRETRYIDFVLPGILGYSLLSSAIFGVAFSFIAFRKENILKKLFAAPTGVAPFLLGQSLSRMIYILLQNIALIVVAMLLFKYMPREGLAGLAQMLMVIVLGLLVFLGFGYAVAGMAKSDDVVSAVANLIVVPQMILGGNFFSVDGLPVWLAFIARLMPVYHFNEAIRLIAINGLNLWNVAVLSHLGWLLLWGVVIYAVASKVFRIR